MDCRRRGGHGIRSVRRFFPDPQPAQAEYKCDSHPDHLSNTSIYPDTITSADNYTDVYGNSFASRAAARRTDVHTLADKYCNALSFSVIASAGRVGLSDRRAHTETKRAWQSPGQRRDCFSKTRNNMNVIGGSYAH